MGKVFLQGFLPESQLVIDIIWKTNNIQKQIQTCPTEAVASDPGTENEDAASGGITLCFFVFFLQLSDQLKVRAFDETGELDRKYHTD